MVTVHDTVLNSVPVIIKSFINAFNWTLHLSGSDIELFKIKVGYLEDILFQSDLQNKTISSISINKI